MTRLDDINQEINRVLEQDRALQRKWLRGEITPGDFNRLKLPIHAKWDKLEQLKTEEEKKKI